MSGKMLSTAHRNRITISCSCSCRCHLKRSGKFDLFYTDFELWDCPKSLYSRVKSMSRWWDLLRWFFGFLFRLCWIYVCVCAACVGLGIEIVGSRKMTVNQWIEWIDGTLKSSKIDKRKYVPIWLNCYSRRWCKRECSVRSAIKLKTFGHCWAHKCQWADDNALVQANILNFKCFVFRIFCRSLRIQAMCYVPSKSQLKWHENDDAEK